MDNNFIINLSGTSFERGVQYGLLLKDSILKAISIWENHFLESNNILLKDYVNFIQEEKYFLEAIEKHTPEYLDEVKGIAKSTGISFSLLFAWQLADEHYWLVKNFNNESRIEEEGCSTFGVIKKEKQIVLGQNLDIPSYKNGLQVILKVDTKESQQIIFTQAGLLGSFGCNTAGLALCVNAISQLGYDEKGLPVSFMVRKILDSSSFDEAENKIKTIPHASGQNYLLGDRIQIKNYECSSNSIHEILPQNNNFLCHTNHPLAGNDNLLPNEKSFFGSTSKERYEQIHNFLLDNDTRLKNELSNCLLESPVYIPQNKHLNHIATFHSAYFVLDDQVRAYTWNNNLWQTIF